MTLTDRDVGNTVTKEHKQQHHVPAECPWHVNWLEEMSHSAVLRDCSPWGHWPLYGAPQEALRPFAAGSTPPPMDSPSLLSAHIWAVIKNIMLFQSPQMIR